MRIGMLADAYRPKVSGVTNFIRLNKRAMEAAGHKVFVFTFGDLDFEDDELNVLRSPGLPLGDTGFYFGFRYARHIRRKLQTMDVVHVHHPFLSGRLAIRYCAPYGIPVVFTNHTRYDLYAHAYLPALPEEAGTAFLEAFMPAFCREVDLVVAPSASLRDVLVDLGVDAAIEVVPNGVDLAPFLQPAAPIERGAWGFGPDHVVLVYVGRLGPEKNLTFLLRAFAGVAQAYPQARLLIVGDGPERDNLEDRARRSDLTGRVHFAGMIDYSELPRHLASCDAFVTASVTEVHPLTVIEALAAGLPALGIRSPGIQDTIEDGVNGLLSGDDVAEFTAMLTRLVSEDALRRRLAAQARPSAERYDVKRTSAILLDHYQRLTAQRRPRRENRWRRFWHRLVDRVT